jgi:ectoine hydroxylase-related dioxygenase (phytanoyl-CoA dioxygenase family)
MLQQLNYSGTDFKRDGFALVKDAVDEATLERLLAAVEPARKTEQAAGLRNLLGRCAPVREFARKGVAMTLARELLGDSARPVRAILFDKTPVSNWYVTWHQDLSIPVKSRVEIEGFGSWSVKDEIVHVQPPASVLENMVSLRFHFDACTADNGAIKFIAGSHKAGILDAEQSTKWKESHESTVCQAERGDIIVMRPLILHSSSVSKSPAHRRVLHIEYACVSLPPPLEWEEA